MTEIEQFDQAVADYGGAYRSGFLPANLETRLLEYFGWLGNHAKVLSSEANCEFRPSFGLIANHEFNAVALRDQNGTACVGLYLGLLQAIDGLFCRVFADPRILIKVGEPELEIELPTLPVDPLSLLTNPNVLQPTPRCEKRRWFADSCAKQALRFVLRHELVHIAHGHIDFLAAQQGSCLMNELTWNQHSESGVFDRQVLEFDADCSAASWWCGVFLEQWFAKNGFLDPKALTNHEIDEKVYPVIEPAFFQWAFSISALFRLFGDAGFAKECLKQVGYPPVRLRQLIVLRTVIDHVRERWNEHLANRLYSVISDGVDIAEASIELVTNSERKVDGLRDAASGVGSEHINTIVDHWKTSLRPRLLPYAIGGYLPP
jgi:hypothetical protein